jgi:hypothetical protein
MNYEWFYRKPLRESDLDPQEKHECEICHITLRAWTQAGLAISVRLHEEFHRRRQTEDAWKLYVGRVQDPEMGTWTDHNDVKWLSDMGIDPMGEDTRSQDEIDARRKPRDNDIAGRA